VIETPWRRLRVVPRVPILSAFERIETGVPAATDA
jgi:hypothetical protein